MNHTYTCDWCGKSFTRRSSRGVSEIRHFCSARCASRYHSELRRLGLGQYTCERSEEITRIGKYLGRMARLGDMRQQAYESLMTLVKQIADIEYFTGQHRQTEVLCATHPENREL